MVKMPTTLGQLNTPRAGRPIANINATPVFSALEAGSREMGRGTQALASGLQRASNAVYRRQLEDEERELKTLDVEFSRKRREITKNFYATQGENTLQSRAGLDKQFTQAREALLKKASSARVRQAFGLLAQGKTEQELGQADDYTERQRREASVTASEAVMQEAFQDAVTYADDPARQILLQKQVAQEVDSQASIKGWSDEVVKSKKQAAISQLYKNQIYALAENNPTKALAVYQQHKEHIDGDVRYAIEKMLADETIDAIAQSGAEEAMAKHPGNISAQRAYIREKYSGKQEEAMVRELDQRLSEVREEVRWGEWIQDQAYQKIARQNALDRLAREQQSRDAKAFFTKGVREGKTREALERENPAYADIANSDISFSSALDRYEIRIAEGKEFAPVSDTKEKQKLFTMDTGDLAKMSEQDIEAAKMDLTKTDWDRLVRYQRGALARVQATQSNTSVFQTGESLLYDYAPKKSDNGKFKLKITDEQYQIAKREMDSFIAGYTDDGKLPTRPEIAKEAQRLMTQIVADPENTAAMLFPKKGEEEFEGLVAEFRSLSAQQKAVATVPIDRIPADKLEQYREVAKKNGISDPSDELLSQLAASDLLNDAARWNRLLGK